MITGEHLGHYLRELIVNSRRHKFIASACISVASLLFCCDNLLPIQFIFVAWIITMVVGTAAGSVKEGFKFKKFFLGGIRLIVYFTILFFGLALDHSFDTNACFNFFYIWIIIDMLHSFLKHAPVLGIGVSPGILKFTNKVEDRVSNFFLNKIGLTEDLDKKHDDEKKDIPTPPIDGSQI